MATGEIERYQANLAHELEGAALYRALAEIERDPKLATVYRRLAEVEERHAAIWQARLAAAGVERPAGGLSWRTRALIWLARRFGVGFVLPSIASLEERDSRYYSRQEDARVAGLSRDEVSHARVLRHIAMTTAGGLEGGLLAQIEGRHRAAGGNALRAAVLGANDGLVSNLSLVMGVAGAALPSAAILVAGLAGLLAGALSMALGEWLSVQSARELYQHQIATEQAEIVAVPEEEAEELALIYQAKGLPEDDARDLAAQIMRDERRALDTLAREELGLDPEELGGSAWEAALASFVLFALGAVVPVMPFLLVSGAPAIVASLVASAVGLFALGAGVTLFTGRSVWFSGSRQVAFGLAAAAITFSIGRLVGTNLAG
jgi:VIT1/CCC1 family predicted Fe2+/Mn2+ transporter